MDIDSFEPTSMSEVNTFVSETLKVSLIDHLSKAKECLDSEFLAIYRVGCFLPIIVDDGELVNTAYNKQGDKLELEEILTLARDVYSFDGKLIMSRKSINDKMFYISGYRNLASCSKFLTSVVADRLRTKVRLDRLTEHSFRSIEFTNSKEELSYIEKLLDNEFELVDDFITGNSSYIYSLRCSSTDFFLEKKMDYRIYEFYRKKFEE